LDTSERTTSSRAEKCLAALRAELRVSYPKIRPLRLLWILRRNSLSRFPNSFLVAGKISDFSRRGALANLIRYQRGRDGHALFSRVFYEMAYPDIAAARAPAWAHYQTRGSGELRSPFPLFDVPFLQASLDELPGDPIRAFGNPVDSYLDNPKQWGVNPSPFVDCAGFITSGSWDGSTVPLALIVRDHLSGVWINERLMMIDAEPTVDLSLAPPSSSDVARLLLISAGILLFRNRSGSLTSSGRRWLVGDLPDHGKPGEPGEPGESGESGESFTVIPGFAVGRDAKVFLLAPRRLLSPDSSMIASETSCLSLERGVTLVAPKLSVVTGELTYSELVTLRDSLGPAEAVAPFSLLQEEAMRVLFSVQKGSEIVILPWGQQAHVTCATVNLVEGAEADTEIEPWMHEGAIPFSEIAIVLPLADRARIHADPFVVDALSRGAFLSLIFEDKYGDWISVLSRQKLVVADDRTAAALRSFVPERKMRILPVAIAESQK
jgi:hypothetical protein